MNGNFYRAFEDRYRGSRELIKGRLNAYSAFVAPLAALYPGAPTLDLGCGRGEWLEMMVERGFAASGVDLDEGMLAACRERGLDVRIADALSSLRMLPDNSVALISAFHLVEHLQFEDVQQLIAETRRVLLPGGLMIMETPNPENLIVGTSNFYLDPSHNKPIPPLLLDFMVDYAEFSRHSVVRLQGADAFTDATAIGLRNIFQDVSADYGVVAQKAGDTVALDSFDSAFTAVYGVTLAEMAEGFDRHHALRRQQESENIAAMHVQISNLAVRTLPIDTMQAELANLRDQASQQADTIVGLAAALQASQQQVEHLLKTFNDASQELWEVTLPGLARRMAAAEKCMGDVQMQLAHLEDASEQRLLTAINGLEERFMHQLDVMQSAHLEVASEQRLITAMNELGERFMQQLNAVEERRLESKRIDSQRFDQRERRIALGDRRLVIPPMSSHHQAEFLRAQAEDHLQQAQQRIQQLEIQLDAMYASRSWRITAPIRSAGAFGRRTLSAVRQGRIKTALRRRAVMLVLGPPDMDATRGVRGLLRRTKNSTRVRRLVLPFLNRFPQLKAPLLRMVQGAGLSAPIPSGDITLPDWDGPLPVEYLYMTNLGRKVLLDLARTASSNP